MSKGYQVIEPRMLDALFSHPIHDVFAVAILTWLCGLLRLEFEEYLDKVEFDVICVTYMGSYPAIGIHYKNKSLQDIGPLVEATIDRYLQGKSVLELVGFIVKDEIDWKKEAARILAG